MTELMIDGYSVVLPGNISFPIKTENPFLTKNGEYTYDITLSLNNDTNRRIFKHINRINGNDYPTEWKAILIADSRVILNGKAIFISNTDTEISIQLVSGNSELNFLIGGDRLISSLDLGSIPSLTKEICNKSLSGSFPEWGYVVTPIWCNKVYNDYTIDIWNDIWEVSDMIPQPYLAYYAEAIPKALGYEIAENVLKTKIGIHNNLYILNLTSSLDYKDYIPGWSVNDFISEIEKLLNILFVVDKNSKSVKILDAANLFDFAKHSAIIKSIDNYNIEFIEDNKLSVDYSSIAYNFPEKEYYKFMNITPSTYKTAVVIDIASLKFLQDFFKDHIHELYNNNVIYHTLDRDLYYVVDKNRAGDGYYYREVNVFKSININKDDEEPKTLLKIIPAQVIPVDYTYPAITSGESYDMWGTTQVPIYSNNDPSADIESKNGILKRIKSGIKKETASENIEVAVFFGKHKLLNRQGNYLLTTPLYPLSCTDYKIEFVETIIGLLSDGWIDSFGYNSNYTLRLTGKWGRYENIYSKNPLIEAARKYEFTFKVNSILDPRSIFIIKNKSFICQEIEYEMTKSGIGKIAKGIFYPYKLSKEEKEWILKDYNWNDKGIWDDEQPWNDINPDLNWTLNEGIWNDISFFSENGEWNDDKINIQS